MAYDPAGNLVKSWDGNNNLCQYEYDAFNRRKTMIYPDETANNTVDNTTETWTYDLAGNQLSRPGRASSNYRRSKLTRTAAERSRLSVTTIAIGRPSSHGRTEQRRSGHTMMPPLE